MQTAKPLPGLPVNRARVLPPLLALRCIAPGLVLSSTMHMAWVRAVAGRMRNDYSYSTGIVYNNFSVPAGSVADDPAHECYVTTKYYR